MPHLTETLALLVTLGLAAQWLGWRLQVPAIVLLILVGSLVGPALGLVRPSADLGPAFEPMVRLAVAVILFEGGLTLHWDELRHAGRGVLRLISLTVVLSWTLGAAAGHWIAGVLPARLHEISPPPRYRGSPVPGFPEVPRWRSHPLQPLLTRSWRKPPVP
jgi:NhaP-type Na+/H+ or K+/H+ antiporter